MMTIDFTLSDCLVKTTETVCWNCKKACGGCSWSSHFAPIPGWSAVKTSIKHWDHGKLVLTESYKVLACPDFENEAPRWRCDYLREGAHEL